MLLERLVFSAVSLVPFLCAIYRYLDLAGLRREAKGVPQSLKELLKTKEPSDRGVDFQRKKS
jgi:hypothetical protein